MRSIAKSHQELGAIPLDSLPPHLRVDHRVMAAQLKFLIRLIGDRKYHQRAVDTYTAEPFRGIDWQLQQMQDLGNGLRGTEAEWKHVVSRVESIHAYLDRAKANLTAGKQAGNVPDWRMVRRNGIESSLASIEYFRTTLPETAAGYVGTQPFGQTVIPQLKQAGAQASAAWEDFAKFLDRRTGRTAPIGLPQAPRNMNGASVTCSGTRGARRSCTTTAASRSQSIQR